MPHIPQPDAADIQTNGHLRLRNLVKAYPNSSGPAVDDVSLTIDHGRLVTILGPSGCGKTTTLRVIAGLEEPTGGSVLLDGKDITQVPASKRPMAIVFQNYALFPHLTVFENIEYGLRTKKGRGAMAKDAAAVAAASMNLAGFEDRMPGQLSGGQQQRVALARAMVLRPKVMLLDEPLSNLDAKLREQMRHEIKDLQRKLGTTTVYVTHDQAEAMSLSDTIVIMNRGRIVQVAPPADIYLRPANAFVADFIGRASLVSVQATVQGSGTRTTARIRPFGEELTVAAHPSVSGQHQGVLMLRPEAVFVSESTSSSDGIVISSMYFGGAAEYRVDTAIGVVLVSVPRPDPGTLLPAGTRVNLSITAPLAYLLPG
ncbi:MAG TPA: ABC transporter ATP-binding protein [Humibacter sp.]|nr:ABC transporter ATP-binding protein [Humibacter sp.]